MIRITILGWYGTETIGDRAILAGLFDVFGRCFDSFEIKLGSLFPFFTERTLLEDYDFYNRISKNSLKGISIFNSQRIGEMRTAIKKSDFIIFGGGPIMNDDFLYLMEYGFKYAKQNNKRTGVIGCGLGPLTCEEYIKIAIRIINNSDIVILRDSVSSKYLNNQSNDFKITYSIDPAVFAAKFFRDNNAIIANNSSYVAVNFRDLTYVDKAYDGIIINNYLIDLIKHELNTNSNNILLVPNHTFAIGGDDRYYLNKLCFELDNEKVKVQNQPLSLDETMRVYQNAVYCYGMRFHTALLMTVLNGHAFILDYTDPVKGKIVGLLHALDLYQEYNNRGRYVNLLKNDLKKRNPDFEYNITVLDDMISKYQKIYVDAIENLFK